MQESKNFNFKVPKTQGSLIREILKRWWYARDFTKQAKGAFGYDQIAEFMKRKSNEDADKCEIPPSEIGKSLIRIWGRARSKEL